MIYSLAVTEAPNETHLIDVGLDGTLYSVGSREGLNRLLVRLQNTYPRAYCLVPIPYNEANPQGEITMPTTHFGTIAQAIDVIVRHRPGITKQELRGAINCDMRSITLDTEWLDRNGHIVTAAGERFFPNV